MNNFHTKFPKTFHSLPFSWTGHVGTYKVFDSTKGVFVYAGASHSCDQCGYTNLNHTRKQPNLQWNYARYNASGQPTWM